MCSTKKERRFLGHERKEALSSGRLFSEARTWHSNSLNAGRTVSLMCHVWCLMSLGKMFAVRQGQGNWWNPYHPAFRSNYLKININHQATCQMQRCIKKFLEYFCIQRSMLKTSRDIQTLPGQNIKQPVYAYISLSSVKWGYIMNE